MWWLLLPKDMQPEPKDLLVGSMIGLVVVAALCGLIVLLTPSAPVSKPAPANIEHCRQLFFDTSEGIIIFDCSDGGTR